jgi:hypothetical protein
LQSIDCQISLSCLKNYQDIALAFAPISPDGSVMENSSIKKNASKAFHIFYYQKDPEPDEKDLNFEDLNSHRNKKGSVSTYALSRDT